MASGRTQPRRSSRDSAPYKVPGSIRTPLNAATSAMIAYPRLGPSARLVKTSSHGSADRPSPPEGPGTGSGPGIIRMGPAAGAVGPGRAQMRAEEREDAPAGILCRGLVVSGSGHEPCQDREQDRCLVPGAGPGIITSATAAWPSLPRPATRAATYSRHAEREHRLPGDLPAGEVGRDELGDLEPRYPRISGPRESVTLDR